MSASGGRDWDAATYDRISAPQQEWAAEQLERLELTGDEVVLDAGCGSGRVTAMLAELVPRGRVYGVDVAPSMVEHAARALGQRATIFCHDLSELDLPEQVDAVFSNATFHWVPDHEALFAAVHRTLKPGGQLVAQCGGRGNIDSFRRESEALSREEPFASYFAGWRQPWNYASAEETEDRLRRAGFTSIRCWLEPKPTTPPEPREFARTVCLVGHLDVLPQALREPFLDGVMERVAGHRDAARAIRSGKAGSHAGRKREGGPVTLDYVRLNIVARRAATLADS